MNPLRSRLKIRHIHVVLAIADMGNLLRAAQALNIDLAQSWMVGDRWRDIDCGHAAGCKTIFIDSGYVESLRQKPDFSARHLGEAADIILRVSNNL